MNSTMTSTNNDMFSFIEPPTLVIGKKPSTSNSNSTLTPTGLLLSSPHLFLMENDFQSLIQSTSTPTGINNNTLTNHLNNYNNNNCTNDLVNHHLFLLQTPTSPTTSNTVNTTTTTINTQNNNAITPSNNNNNLMMNNFLSSNGGLLSPDFDQNSTTLLQSTNSVITPTSAMGNPIWLQQQLCDIIDDVFPEADQLLNNNNNQMNVIEQQQNININQCNIANTTTITQPSAAAATSILSVLLNNVSPVNNNTTTLSPNNNNNNTVVVTGKTSPIINHQTITPIIINNTPQCNVNLQQQQQQLLQNNNNINNTNNNNNIKTSKKKKTKSISPTSTITNTTNMSTKSFFNTNIDPSAFYYGTSGFLKFHDYSGRLNHSKKKNHTFAASCEKIQKQNKMLNHLNPTMMNNTMNVQPSQSTQPQQQPTQHNSATINMVNMSRSSVGSNMMMMSNANNNNNTMTSFQQQQQNIYDEMKFKSACPNQVFYKM